MKKLLVGVAAVTLFGIVVLVLRKPGGESQQIQTLIENEYYWGKNPFNENWRDVKSGEEMVSALPDRYSRVLSEAAFDRFMELRHDVFRGLGLAYAIEESGVVVTQIFPDSPAEHSGLKPGDMIVQVNGQDVSELDEVGVNMLLDKSVGVEVEIEIGRQGVRSLKKIKSAEFEAQTVVYKLLSSGLGYLRIYMFGGNTEVELLETVEQIIVDEVTHLVIDLRGNGGGESGASLVLANEIVPVGYLVHYKNRVGKGVGVGVSGGGRLYHLNQQVVVLVDRYTASEAEMLAVALKDNGRAVVIGEQTYGKGAVVTLFPLVSGRGLVLVTGEWLRPNLESVEGVGIVPDKLFSEVADWKSVPWGEVVQGT